LNSSTGHWALSMRIVYLSYVPLDDRTGIPEKIAAWANAMRQYAEVQVLAVDTRPGAGAVTAPDQWRMIRPSTELGGRLARLSSGATLLPELYRVLVQTRASLIYLRHPLYRPGLPSILSRIAPYVMEVNGIPYRELMLQGRSAVALVDRLLGRGLFRRAAGYVGVTRESIEYARSRAVKPGIVIGNGVDCDTVSFLPPSDRNDGRIHLAFVGSPSTYDGLDRLFEGLLRAARHAVGVVLHLVGPGWGNSPLLSQVARYAEVKLYGYVPPGQLPEILRMVDVGVGPLGVHRKGLHEASSLKVRRYLAHGIPVVMASRDPDIEGRLPFVCWVEASDTPLVIEDLITFARAARNHDVRAEARRFAETRLSYKVKAAQFYTFFRRVLSGHSGGGL